MKNRKNRSIRSLLASSNGLPIGERERIEITKKGNTRTIIVEGIRQILLYGAEEMVFLMSEGRLSICGRELDCVTYASGAIGIDGEIISISFLEGGRNETA
ncbi:MAG: YabP/YqfC family sporulation protein [Clostridia bacterium]|nr:YabP/YqfC family sporulation protein [Clostridia bacterium]